MSLGERWLAAGPVTSALLTHECTCDAPHAVGWRSDLVVDQKNTQTGTHTAMPTQ